MKPTRHHRLSYKKVGWTGIVGSMTAPAGTVTLLPRRYASVAALYIPQGRVVLQPKASWLTKLPQRPMHWPIKKPMPVRSNMASRRTLRHRQASPPKITAPMMPP